ncbi:ankyrin repeat domain-containing protein SOWAHC isoform X3 [Nematostella vectensis]|uniref:ankyrin repeat domain-containing protein SOWAHC isoform X2 n=1 Tax=Nematostella vectensis TaxID=45351 RepID=UPI00207780C5|nr:ankyrin repeat domain-containing protein SOWAHC isoform X2 [Nematostella vectensis]XP_048576668.1 ankyrin repeat domain-containing protein SOWAHC isoform X3 [Nematostella vectensis]
MMVAKAGADVNSKTHGGYTPLHLAAMHGNDRVIKVLVDDFKADINARDFSGRKPRQVAKDTLTIEAQRRLEHVLTLSDDDCTPPSTPPSGQERSGGTLRGVLRHISFKKQRDDRRKSREYDLHHHSDHRDEESHRDGRKRSKDYEKQHHNDRRLSREEGSYREGHRRSRDCETYKHSDR